LELKKSVDSDLPHLNLGFQKEYLDAALWGSIMETDVHLVEQFPHPEFGSWAAHIRAES